MVSVAQAQASSSNTPDVRLFVLKCVVGMLLQSIIQTDSNLSSSQACVQQMIGLYPDRIVTVSVNELDPLSCKQWRGDLLVLCIFEEALSSAGNQALQAVPVP